MPRLSGSALRTSGIPSAKCQRDEAIGRIIVHATSSWMLFRTAIPNFAVVADRELDYTPIIPCSRGSVETIGRRDGVVTCRPIVSIK